MTDSEMKSYYLGAYQYAAPPLKSEYALPYYGRAPHTPRYPLEASLSCGHQHLRNRCADCATRLCGPCSRADTGWGLHCRSCWSALQTNGRG